MQVMPDMRAPGQGWALSLIRIVAVVGTAILVATLLSSADVPAGWVIMTGMGCALAGFALALLYTVNRLRDDEAELHEMRERQRQTRAIHSEALKRSLRELVRLQVAEAHQHGTLEIAPVDEDTVNEAADKTINDIIAVSVPFGDDDDGALPPACD